MADYADVDSYISSLDLALGVLAAGLRRLVIAAGIVRVTGQKMGYVRVAGPADIAPSVLTDLIKQAAALNAELGNPARTR